MFVSNSLGITDGHLTLGGVDTVLMAEKFGTPLYLFDEDRIRENCRNYVSAMREHYGNGTVAYASKAFLCAEMAKVMNEEGMSLDVVSGGEIYTALKAAFPASRMFFHGNNKTHDELELAVDCGVGRIVVDGLEEAESLNNIAGRVGKKVAVLMRITPGIDAHTHSFIKTGQIDSKFGVTLENGDALRSVGSVLKMENLELKGFHCHIGSQIFETEPFAHAADVMINFMCAVRSTYSVELHELDLGGGFGIRYTSEQNRAEYGEYVKAICEALKRKCAEVKYELPYLIIEPGRSIVGEAGITLYTVGRVKSIPGVRTYVSVDGGMTDNPRYALYKSPYEACIANKADNDRDFVVTIAGKCCESGDLIQENCNIQRPERGDILAVFSTGAYNYSMSSNYNRICRPAAVFLRNGKPRVVIRRETYQDIVKNDVLK